MPKDGLAPSLPFPPVSFASLRLRPQGSERTRMDRGPPPFLYCSSPSCNLLLPPLADSFGPASPCGLLRQARPSPYGEGRTLPLLAYPSEREGGAGGGSIHKEGALARIGPPLRVGRRGLILYFGYSLLSFMLLIKLSFLCFIKISLVTNY